MNRQMVLEKIKEMEGNCTTQELANALSTPERLIPERSVRSAVFWLVLSGYLEKSETLVIRRDSSGNAYKVWLYTWTGKDRPITGHRADGIRQNREERAAQVEGDKFNGGVFLQQLFLGMKGKK